MALTIAAASATAQAQTAPDTGQPTTNLETPSDGGAPAARKILNTISVTATRNPIESFEYPGMVSVIGRESIQTRQPSTADDVLRGVPNVAFTGGPRRTGEVPSIRGFQGADVIVLFDGARQNFGSAHDGRFFLDPSLIKQVEVLRGPASSLYGSGGTGGVIEFRTVDAADLLRGDERLGARISGGYQSVNREKFGTFSTYGQPTDELDLVFSVTKRDSGSIELGDGSKLTRSDDDILSGLAKAGLTLGTHHRIEGAFVGFSNDAEEPNNGQSATAEDEVDKEVRSSTYRLNYGYRNPANPLFDIDALLYYTDLEVDERRLDDAGGGSAGELLQRDVKTVGFRLDNRSRAEISDQFAATLTYGGEFYRDKQNGAAGDGDRDGVPDATAKFYGLFLQGELSFSELFGVVPGDILVIPGLRFDSFKADSEVDQSNSDQALSPRIGLSYLPTEWLLFFGNYAHAFRAPTTDELYLTGTHFRIPVGAGVVNRFVPNPDLKPQRTRTVEFGGGLDFDDVIASNDRFQTKASYFRIWGKDFINLQVDQPALFTECNPFIPGDCDGTTELDNVSRAKLWGTEVESSYESDRFLLTFGYARINGEDRKTGDKLGTLTPDRFSLEAAVKVPELDAIVGWRGLVARDFDKVNDPEDERDGYDVHDIYLAWAPFEGPLSGLRLDLGIDNLLDENYARVFTGATEAGRNYKATLSYAINW